MNRPRFIILKNLVWLLVLLLQTQETHGQEIPFTKFTAENGLPSSNVYRVMQDRKGFLWLPTDAGVARFDGRAFEVFTREDGLTNNDVLSIAEDSSGRIWFLTLAGGLCYYLDGRIVNPETDTVLAKGPKSTFVSAMFEDSRHRLWFSTRDNGVYCLDGNEMQHYGLDYDDSDQGPGAVWETPDGKILVRLYGNVAELYPNSQVNRRLPKSFSLISCDYVLPHRQGVLMPDVKGRVWYHGAENDSIVISSRLPYKSNYITMLPDSSVWLASSEGGAEEFAWDARKRQWRYVRRIFQKQKINGITSDSEGNTWFATRGDGVLLVHPQKILNYPGQDGLGVRQIFRDSTGQYLFATSDHRLARTREPNITAQWKIYSLFFGSEFNGILKLPSGLLATYGPGVVVLRSYDFQDFPGELNEPVGDGKSGAFAVKLGPESVHFIGTGSAKRAIINKEGYLIVATNAGLFRIEYTDAARSSVERLKVGRFSAISVDDADGYWVGQSDGLYRYQNGDLASYKHLHSAFSTAPEDLVYSPATGLWVATNGQGVLNFNPETGRIVQLKQEDGLAGNLCSRLYLEGEDYLWVATKRGLSRIDLHANLSGDLHATIHSLTHKDGLIDNEVTSLCFVGDTVLAATPKGLSVFHKKEMDYVLPPPRPFLRGVSVNGHPTHVDSTLSLSHHENSLTFYFTGLSLGSLGEGSFQYRLDPIEDEWHQTRQPEASYNQLPPGRYTFRMLAFSKDGVPAEHELTFGFEVHKAWWQTILFRVLTGLLVAGMLWGLIYWQFKARNTRLEMERKLLESERKALRAQMNPHFIFNSLNSIQNFLAQNDRKSAYTYLARFGKLMRSILENSDKTFVPIEEELTVLRLYLQMEALRADHRFTYEINVDESINPLSDQIPPMLLQPYVENAIWHGVMPLPAGGKIQVELSRKNDGILCRVEDNGVGREAAFLKRNESGNVKMRSFGTRISEERLDLMNTSRRRNITVTTTDLRDDAGNASGTRVELFIPLARQE